MGPRRRRRPRKPLRRPRSSRPAVSLVSMAVRILASKFLQHHSYLLRRFHHQVYFRDIPERPDQPGIELVLAMLLHLLESLPAGTEPPGIVLRARTPLDSGAVVDIIADPDFLRNRTDTFDLPAALTVLHVFSLSFRTTVKLISAPAV